MTKSQRKQKNDHSLLAFFLCLPCLIITTAALFIANVSAYLIAFIIIILALIAVFIVVISQQRSQQQIRTLANILESMIDGDYSLRGREQDNKAFQELLTLVNNLADTLALSKIEAKESRQLLERIMQQMDAMVLAVDEQGRIVMANNSAQKLLKINMPQQAHILFTSLAIGKVISEAQSGIIDFEQPQLSGEHFLFKEYFLSEGKQHQLFLITSAQRLLLEKERKSWQSLLRVLSHEMNNSLTPISSISQSMRTTLQDEHKVLNRESLLTGIDIINERASSLSLFIASYSQLSHLPEPNKRTFALQGFINNCAALFSDCRILFPEKYIELAYVNISADKAQLEQVFINILKNAKEAMEGINNNTDKIITVFCQTDDKYFHIHICDSGSGIANKNNLFVPFYSTKPKGSGIGLALCKQILFNHGGLLSLKNNANSAGAEAIISLPKY
ncbi:sensor histidine kinase [Colwellia hornerae]|uniref:histidine kinase n=1 Tax=Colwellia hornerae TaxID=89402 RepID=A0A5C6Q9T9_9GAMM|nr:ATP-binding protein [Colwellia hornerae]TWX59520.1 GHKL domain-containing protein [Colwellia hornerae]TWX62890.1 GHKL domain-containing protein [Colwellia hornerae]TWX65825.1 GHKL domain-containing protein [Colwellia hornerae]